MVGEGERRSCDCTSATMKSLLLLLIATSTIASHQDAQYVPPVIIVPGDGGSQIEAKLDKPSVVHFFCHQETDWFDLWLNMELLAPLVIDCWVDNMKLQYNNKTRTTSNMPGVQTRIPGFGNSSTVEWLDPSQRYPTGYFKDIVSAMLPLGYKRDVTVRGAPFDFRKAPNELQDYFQNLTRLTEETHQNTGRRVVFMAHSMGAPMLWYFLNQHSQAWKDKHVQSIISLAGAWGGSVKAVKVYTAGDNLGIYVINARSVREEQRTAGSLAFLLPNPALWGPDEVLVQTPQANYTIENFKELFEALKLPDAYNLYQDTRGLLHQAPPPGVEVYCLYGEGIPTVASLSYKAGKFPDSPDQKTGDGDGTVNIRSAKFCQSWSGKQKQNVHLVSMGKVEHMGIVRDPSSIKYITQLLQNITRANQDKARQSLVQGDDSTSAQGDRRQSLGQENRISPAQEDQNKRTAEENRIAPGQENRIAPGQENRITPGQENRITPAQENRITPAQGSMRQLPRQEELQLLQQDKSKQLLKEQIKQLLMEEAARRSLTGENTRQSVMQEQSEQLLTEGETTQSLRGMDNRQFMKLLQANKIKYRDLMEDYLLRDVREEVRVKEEAERSHLAAERARNEVGHDFRSDGGDRLPVVILNGL